MRNVLLVLLTALLTGCASVPTVAVTPGYDINKLGAVALLDFDDLIGSAGSGRIASQSLEPYLLSAGYRLIDRSEVENIPESNLFDRAGGVNQNAVENLGKALKVNAIIVGGVTNFVQQRSDTYMTTVSNVSYVPRSVGRRGTTHYDVIATQDQVPVTQNSPASMSFAAHLVDTTTGEVLWSGSTQADGLNPADAADIGAKKMVKALQKTLAKNQSKK